MVLSDPNFGTRGVVVFANSNGRIEVLNLSQEIDFGDANAPRLVLIV